eukprot:PITA_19394
MLSGVGLGQEFWAEAVETACYLVNISPSSALKDKTPQEGYKLWNLVTRKVVYNQDVVFREMKAVIKHEVQPKEPQKIDFELKEEESDSTAEEESEDEEPKTPGRPGLEIFLGIRGFVDVEWAGDLDQRRSTSGYVFSLFGGAVSWMSKKQFVVALSTTEAEYMPATHASKEVVWLQRLCSSMGLVQGTIRIYCDSQSKIFLAKNPAYHSKTKHIDVQCHFVRDMIEDKKLLLVKDTLTNTADALTKYASSRKFSWCRETMGVARLDK